MTKQALFPTDHSMRASFFAEAIIYFLNNPTQNKYDRKLEWIINCENSFVRAEDGKVYMLARSDSDPDENEAYLGFGSYANVKRAIDSEGRYVAIVIRKVDKPIARWIPSLLHRETGLYLGQLYRISDSEKKIGCSSSAFTPFWKEYQIQKMGPGSLREFLFYKKDKLDSLSRFKIALRIILAVSQLHHRDIAHLDLTPDNILIDPTSLEIQLIDFDFSEQVLNVPPLSLKGTADYLFSEKNIFVDENRDRVKVTKLALDLHALIKIIYIPSVIFRVSHVRLEMYAKNIDYFDIIRRVHNSYVLFNDDINEDRNGLHFYTVKNCVFSPIAFSSCEDLAIVLIGRRYLFSDDHLLCMLRNTSLETKRLFLDDYLYRLMRLDQSESELKIYLSDMMGSIMSMPTPYGLTVIPACSALLLSNYIVNIRLDLARLYESHPNIPAALNCARVLSLNFFSLFQKLITIYVALYSSEGKMLEIILRALLEDDYDTLHEASLVACAGRKIEERLYADILHDRSASQTVLETVKQRFFPRLISALHQRPENESAVMVPDLAQSLFELKALENEMSIAAPPSPQNFFRTAF